MTATETTWTLDAQYVDALRRGELVEIVVDAGGHTMRWTLWMDKHGDIRTDAPR